MALLRTLRIRNLVIIEELSVEFGPGFNLLTGETGAGKSILVDALGLVSGARADRSLVRSGEQRATVEALFEIDADEPAAGWLTEQTGYDPADGELLVRRELPADGSGRIQLNGAPCTLAMLRELASLLLELHGQHAPRSLLAGERHLEILDALGLHLLELERVRGAHGDVAKAAAELEELRELAAEREQRLGEGQATVAELEELAPEPGELARLDRERRVLQNAGRVADLLDSAVGFSYESEPSAASLAARAAAAAEELAELDGSLADTAARIRSAAVELDDAGNELRGYRDGADFDESRLEQLETRRAALEHACLRYATDEAGLIEKLDAAREELRTLADFEGSLAEAEAVHATAVAAYVECAAELTRKRRAAANKLEQAVAKQFASLALGKARLAVDLQPARAEYSARGAERAEFLLAANPGEPLRPLRQVASGGELSRVMLALHVVAESLQARRALVFDEIDAGVGGAVADAVGARLQRLSSGRQLLCITHLPQVAAYADLHFHVSKRVASGRTHAGIDQLTASQRVEELARMLGGKKPTAAARKNACELLGAAGRRPRAVARSEP
jgi:DNA repair protein RecN (Recombination protein N)